MKPYYERDGITIYHGDTLTVLEAIEIAEFDGVIMDPPYASGARTEAKKSASGSMLRGSRWNAKPIENDQMTSTGFTWLIRQVCFQIRARLKNGGSVLSFIDWRQWPNIVGAIESTNLRVNNMVVWDKISYGLGNGFRSQHELIVHASRGTPHIINKGIPNVLSFKRDNNKDHPSPKPVGLIGQLIKVISDENDLILDPFMGVGPTLRAAKDLGRRAIGIEIEEKYCEIAVERLRQGLLL